MTAAAQRGASRRSAPLRSATHQPTLAEALTLLAEWQAAGRPTHPTTRTEAGLRDRRADKDTAK